MSNGEKASIYGAHPGVEHEARAIANLPKTTGRSIEGWLALLEASGPEGEEARTRWLKEAHGLGTHQARWVAERASRRGRAGEDDPDAMVNAMYAGPKAGLRPIHEAIVAAGLALGDDVRATACRTFVTLSRRYVFAQIKPTTRTRIDLGFALGDAADGGRLASTGGLARKDRITHKVGIAGLADLDGEVLRWLNAAYDRDA